jgi:hypothetical protein
MRFSEQADEDSGILGWYTVSTGLEGYVFLDCLIHEIKALHFSEMLITIYQSICCNMP